MDGLDSISKTIPAPYMYGMSMIASVIFASVFIGYRGYLSEITMYL